MTAAIPVLDLTRYDEGLKSAIAKAVSEVFATGRFVMGPANEAFEKAFCPHAWRPARARRVIGHGRPARLPHGRCPLALAAAKEVLALPVFPELTDAEVERVGEAVLASLA